MESPNDTTHTSVPAHQPDADAPRPLNELLQPGDTVMVMAPDREAHARPLTLAAVDDHSLSMLVDARAEWAGSLRTGDRLTLSLSDNRRNSWVSLVGRAVVNDSPTVIDELWNPGAELFFDNGRDTPGIVALVLVVDDGSYWSSPSGRLGGLVSMVRAAIGDSDDFGDHGPVALPGDRA